MVSSKLTKKAIKSLIKKDGTTKFSQKKGKNFIHFDQIVLKRLPGNRMRIDYYWKGVAVLHYPIETMIDDYESICISDLNHCKIEVNISS